MTKRRLSEKSGKAFGAVIPVFGKKREDLRKFVERSLRKSTVNPLKTGVVGFDVARTPKGFKLIEANSFPAGLGNPIKNLRAKTRLLGKLPIKAALGVSLTAGVTAFIVSRLAKRERCANPKFITRGGVVVPICPKGK